MGAEEKKPKSYIWVYLIPVYVLIAYPLSKWIRDINSGDVKLSEAQRAAFTTKAEPVKPPPLEPEAPESGEQNTIEELPEDLMMPAQSEPGADVEQVPAKPQPKMDVDKWQKFGGTPGLLLQAVGKSLNNPAVIKTLFNNPSIVRAFLERPAVKLLLRDPAAMKRFLTDPKKTDSLLKNPVFKKAAGNSKIVFTVAHSKLMDELLLSEAMQLLMQEPQSLRDIYDSNPEYARLAANANIAEAARTTPLTAKAAAHIPGLK